MDKGRVDPAKYKWAAGIAKRKADASAARNWANDFDERYYCDRIAGNVKLQIPNFMPIRLINDARPGGAVEGIRVRV